MKRHILESIVEDASYGAGDDSEAPSQEAWVSMQKRFGKEFTLEERAFVIRAWQRNHQRMMQL